MGKTITQPCLFALVRFLAGYAIINKTNENDIAIFATMQEAFDFWDWAHTGEPLEILIYASH